MIKHDLTWPVLKRYDQDHLARIALPLGGIGAGTVSLGGRGQLCDWEVMNRPAKGYAPRNTFFALYARPAGGAPVTRLLEGAIPPPYEGPMGCVTPNHGLPHFRSCSFETSYPFGRVLLSDPDVPVTVKIEGFNPLVPADPDASGIPVAVLRFVLTNRTGRKLEASVCGCLENFIGTGGAQGKPLRNRNAFRSGPGPWKGLFLSSDGVPAESEFSGTLALATDADRVSHRTAWPALSWGDTLLDFWDDFSSDGVLEPRECPGADAPIASLAARVTLPPRGTRSVTFLLAWRFPNRMTWNPGAPAADAAGSRARTPFVRTAEVSAFQPADPELARWDYPGDTSGMGFEARTFAGDFLSLRPEIEKQGAAGRCVLYRVRLACAEPMRLDALLGYDGPVRVWVDGQLRYHDPKGANPAAADSVRVGFDAAAGEHEVLVALGAAAGAAGGLFLRFERTDLPLSRIRGEARLAPFLPVLLGQSPSACGCAGGACGPEASNRVGNYYATRYADAWDVVRKTGPALAALEARTAAFVRAFCGSDLPAEVKESALFNLSTLRSQTCFRIETGEFFGWEGCGDACGCCHGSCTHVWNYETATAFLFGELSRSMRDTEFRLATAEDGLMSFRVNLPLARAGEFRLAAADGQMGCLMKLYRDWQLSGDEAMLRALWPKARRALEFAWIPGGWDADADGVMEGCQHNTMDVEYYGPNPQMQFWYLGALRAAEAMARQVGEDDFAARCRSLFEKGSAWTDAHLFNGDYYEHEIRPPAGESAIASGLRVGMGASDLADPALQLGAGCLVDQLVGQYLAHVCGLGYLADRAKVAKTLASVMAFNFREHLHGHFNHLRTFAMNDEAALLMCSYPKGRRPKRPFPYYNEVMTGFEYAAATHMLYEGQVENGLKAIRAIRNRYDGKRRNPFDEAECGHHYGRALASWTGVLALTGFQYSGVEQKMTLAAKAGRHFWSNGDAWGTCDIRGTRRAGWKVTLRVLHGKLRVKRLGLAGVGETVLERGVQTLAAGKSAVLVMA